MSDTAIGTDRRMWVVAVPRDTVLVRDGRSFDAGTDVVAETVRPWPSTVAGAIRQAYGREPAEVRGPVLGLAVRRAGDGAAGETWRSYFPMPADIVVADGAARWAFRLRPQPTAISTDLAIDGLQWLTGAGLAGKSRPLGGWLPGSRLGAYLRGELLGPAGGMAVGELQRVEAEPLTPERRVGLARTPGRTASAGLLYQATHLRLRDGWGFLAECKLPEGWDDRGAPTGPVPLGGRGRLTDIRPTPGVRWPDPPTSHPGGRVLVYVATPALWPGGWRIPEPPGARLVAAAMAGDPEPVATASPRLGLWATRALRWAVPAGSVYLLEFGDQAEADRWAAAVHGTAYGRAADDRLRTAGFGVVLTGVWS
jgi:CRISPR-associated protein Cmr3